MEGKTEWMKCPMRNDSICDGDCAWLVVLHTDEGRPACRVCAVAQLAARSAREEGQPVGIPCVCDDGNT